MGNKSKRTIKPQTAPFDLDALEKEAKSSTSDKNFRFILGGHEFSLPPFGTLDRKVLTSMDPDDPESIMSVFKAAMSDKDYDIFDEQELSIEGLNALEGAWSEHSGVTPGES
jgi:hypothetical protein